MPSIAGHSVLVIGGSSGIGAAVAKLAAEQGALVSIASSNPTRVANAVASLKSSLPDAHIKGFTIDLSTPDVETHLETLLTEATSEQKLDHIILTAGRADMRSLAETNRAYLLDDTHLRLVVPTLLAKLAPPFLTPRYTSSLSFCGGRLAARPMKGWPAAAIHAAGLDGLTRALALDLAPLRVNVVHPGATETELWGATAEERRARVEFVAQTALLGKVGSAEEVGEAFVYLMRDSNLTGASVHSSGGSLVQ
ncbi:NAD(P)-binding protein [Aspergillus pseudoustus]|uniref:NAD(P)-binding protein n=1 Tax=Aspergillus pseudoustus TaxID=1810923 RepID=A0ABR4K4F6_9EURO